MKQNISIKIRKLLNRFHFDNSGLNANDDLLDLYTQKFGNLIQDYLKQLNNKNI